MNNINIKNIIDRQDKLEVTYSNDTYSDTKDNIKIYLSNKKDRDQITKKAVKKTQQILNGPTESSLQPLDKAPFIAKTGIAGVVMLMLIYFLYYKYTSYSQFS